MNHGVRPSVRHSVRHGVRQELHQQHFFRGMHVLQMNVRGRTRHCVWPPCTWASLCSPRLATGTPPQVVRCPLCHPTKVTETCKNGSRREKPWPLVDDGGSLASQRWPWVFLGVAAVSFFLGLVLYSAYKSFELASKNLHIQERGIIQSQFFA